MLGVIGGGLLVAIIGQVLPKMASEMMSATMRSMMAGMGEDGCDPEDI
jgi:hypothetical protein